MPQRAKDYSRGVIYKIVNSVDDMEYFGSTAQKYYKQRWAKHTYDARHGNTAPVFQHMRKVGIDNCRMVLLEKYPCKDEKELTIREEWWRAQAKKVLNQNRCYRTREQQLQDKLNYAKRDVKIKFICACGGRTCKHHKNAHVRTKRHQKWAKANPTLTEYSQFLTPV